MPHHPDIRTIQARIKMNGKEDLWRDWYSRVLTSAHLRNVLLAPRNARRGRMLASLCEAQQFAELGFHLPLQAYHPKSGKHMSVK